MGRGRTILTLVMCGALALTLGACGGRNASGGNVGGGDNLSSGASTTTENPASKVLQKGNDLSSYERHVGENDYLKTMTSNVSAFTYNEPSGWEKETTDRFVLYKKTDGSDVLAIIVVAQDGKDHAKDKSDMNRLSGNAYSCYSGGFLEANDCDVEESGRKIGFAGVPSSPSDDTCYIDGCGMVAEDYTVTGNPSFGEFKGSMLAVGAADAELSAGLISCDSAYEECRKDFLALTGSVHLSDGQREKVSTLLGEDPIVGNTFSGDDIHEICEKAKDSANDGGTYDEEGQTYGAGTYKVGTDMPAGEYKLTTNSGRMGYWKVTASSAPDAQIIGNDNFTSSTYVTVSDGQYLEIERCVAVPSGK